MLFSTSGIPFAYCNSVNASTGDITIYSFNTGTNYWPTIDNIPARYLVQNYAIARAFFLKNQIPNLPGNMEENKIYYLRKTGNNIKIYTTFQDAVNQSGHITFTTNISGYPFAVFFPDICLRSLNAWKPAEESISDIPCCPPVPEVYTECPDTATITYRGNSVEIKRNGGANVDRNNKSFMNDLKSQQGGGISAHDIVVISNAITYTAIPKDWYVLLKIGFGHYTDQPNLPRPVLNLLVYESQINNYPVFEDTPLLLGYANYVGDISINTSKSMTFNKFESTILNSGLGMPVGAYFSDTIPVTFSGSTPPPSHVKVFMPDAFFANKDKPINLGHVEETLTYDPDTLTYWGDVKTYAGIPGRIHFSIPNYYPLLSSGTKYLANSAFVIEYESNSYPYYRFRRNGEFPDANLNSYSNAEFSLYETCYVEHIVDLYNSFEIYEHKFRLFVASDAYGGYPTGLPQGKTWFDSRIVQNANPDWVGYPVNRLTSKMLIAFSKWGTGKFNKSNGVREFDSVYFSHYKRNFYAIKSVHPNAHITSLGV